MARMVSSIVWGSLANLFPRPRRDIEISIGGVFLPVRFQDFLVILLTSIVSAFLLMRGRCFPVALLIVDMGLLVLYARRLDYVLVSSDQIKLSWLKVKEQQTRLQIPKPRWLLVFIDALTVFSSQLICEFVRGGGMVLGNDPILAGG